MHIGLREPLVAVVLVPRDRPALAIRRQCVVEAHSGAYADVVQGCEDDALIQHPVPAGEVVGDMEPVIATPARENQLHIGCGVVHQVPGQPGVSRHANALPFPRGILNLPEALLPLPVQPPGSGSRRRRRTALHRHPFRLPEPDVVQHRVVREQLQQPGPKPPLLSRVGRVPPHLKSQACEHTPRRGVLQPPREQLLRRRDPLLATTGLPRHVAAPVLPRKEPACPEPELVNAQRRGAPNPLRRGPQRLPADDLPVILIRRERLVVVAVESDEVLPGAHDLVGEEPEVLVVPGGRAVEEVVPREGPSDREDR